MTKHKMFRFSQSQLMAYCFVMKSQQLVRAIQNPRTLRDPHEAVLPHSHPLPSVPNMSLYNLPFLRWDHSHHCLRSGFFWCSARALTQDQGFELAGILSSSVTTDEIDKQERRGFVVPR